MIAAGGFILNASNVVRLHLEAALAPRSCLAADYSESSRGCDCVPPRVTVFPLGGEPFMRCLVTGAAGFIGSHLCERLLSDRHAVTGVDCFTDYYPRAVKERNLASLREHPHFKFRELDLSEGVPADVVAGTQWVFHLAAMAGLTRSWLDFDTYTRHNVTATHRLLEALKGSPTL